MKALTGLIRLHEGRLDERRRELAAAERRHAELLAEVRDLEREIAAEQRVAASSEEAAFIYSSYAAAAIERRDGIETSLAETDVAVGHARNEVNEAYRDFKRYETAARLREARAELAAARREQALLDEIGLVMHNRSRRETAR